MNSLAGIDDLFWLRPSRERLRKSFLAGRMPHGLLIHSAPGLGAETLARWTVALVMCAASPEAAPCGQCRNCRQLAAGVHPDFMRVAREEDATQVAIDQIRALCGAMALKSYAGGYRVAVIAEADLMTISAANALLKTLEEPPPQTLQILLSARPSRLPATIRSRCQAVKLRAPARSAAVEWLQARQARQDWEALLDHAAGSPLKALELAQGGFTETHREMTAALAALRERKLDIQATAGRWSEKDLSLRLDWLETWITGTIRNALVSAVHLPSGPQATKIRGLYGLLERLRGLKLEQNSSLNMRLALEEWLLKLSAALA